VAVGALTALIPRQVLDAAIAVHECRERRVRKPPAHVVVYLLIALCLFPDDDYEQVAEKLTGMIALVPGSRWEPPARGAVTQARRRLGRAGQKVFERVARPRSGGDRSRGRLHRARPQGGHIRLITSILRPGRGHGRGPGPLLP
jgi:hypothetical protein